MLSELLLISKTIYVSNIGVLCQKCTPPRRPNKTFYEHRHCFAAKLFNINCDTAIIYCFNYIF
jgi:hypothetical protein